MKTLQEAISETFDLPGCITILGVPDANDEMLYNTTCEVTGQYGATWCVEYNIELFDKDGVWQRTIDSGKTYVCAEVLDAHHNGTLYILILNEHGQVKSIHYKGE
jgi:hypothetical protein